MNDYTDTVDKATGEVKVPAAAVVGRGGCGMTARTAKLFGIDPSGFAELLHQGFRQRAVPLFPEP